MADTKSKILIIEDDLDVAEMLNAYFRVQGYDVFTVNWGEDGVRSCQTIHPDLVILDIRLPDIDGYEVARRIRSSAKTALAYTPIIAITANALKGDAEKALASGCDVYMSKPINLRELWARVEAFVPAPLQK